ncbi:MAG: ECF-type sigma factor [Planctomycetaceae bacterium]
MNESSGSGPATWVHHLKSGQAEGLNELWARFYDRLVHHSKGRVRSVGMNGIDEESVACSVFESIWRAASEGRLESIQSCDELWWWLLSAAHRKIVDHTRRATALKRGGGEYVADLGDAQALQQLLSNEPTPEYLTILSEEYERGMAILDDEQLKRIAVLKVSGATNEEICEELVIAPATVTRKLRRIYEIWRVAGEQET